MGAQLSRSGSRRVVLGTLASGAVAGAAGCVAGGGTPAATPMATPMATPTTISWFIYNFNARQNDQFDKTVKVPFESENPNLHLDYTTGGGAAKFVTLATSGQAPDAIWWGLPELWTAGLLRKINDLVARDKIDLKIYPQASYRARNVIREAVIALPIQIGGAWPVLPYNPALFARAGVPEPPAKWGDPAWTWQAFADTCRRLQTSLSAAGGDAPRWAINWPTVSDWYVEAHLYTWKTSWLSADWTRATPDAPATIEALQAAADLFLKLKVTAPAGEKQRDDFANFANGNLAMWRTAGGGLGQVIDAVQKGAPFRYAPLPTGKIPASGLQTDGMSLPKEGKHPDAAWLLTKWLAGNDRWARSRALPPGRPDLFDGWAKDVYGGLASSMRAEVYKNALAVGAGQDPVMFQPRLPELRAVIQPALDAIFTGTKPVTDALAGIKSPLQVLLQPIT